jgi:hypothetical protein
MPPDGPLPGPWHHPILEVETSIPRANPEPRALDAVRCPAKCPVKYTEKYVGWQASGWTFQFNVFLSIFLTKVLTLRGESRAISATAIGWFGEGF